MSSKNNPESSNMKTGGGVSPLAVAEVGTKESFVEGLLVRLKVQDSDQCFLLQTAKAVLGPGGESKKKNNHKEDMKTNKDDYKHHRYWTEQKKEEGNKKVFDACGGKLRPPLGPLLPKGKGGET